MAAEVHTGAMIALVPTDADIKRLAVDGGEAPEELHLTLYYLGKAADYPMDLQDQINSRIGALAERKWPLQAEGFHVTMFNPQGKEPCVVMGVSNGTTTQALDVVHDLVGDAIEQYVAGKMPQQHSPWVPHITLEYTKDQGRAEELMDRVGPITFDRIRMAWAGRHIDYKLGSDEKPVVAQKSWEFKDIKSGVEVELKVVRHVRTPAGARRYGKPIGSIITSDGSVLKNLKTEKTEYVGFALVRDSKGRGYYVGKWDGYDGVYATDENDDYNVVAEGKTTEEVLKKLDAIVGKTGGAPDSPEEEDLDKMTLPQLRAIARRELSTGSRLTKRSELIGAIRAMRAKRSGAGGTTTKPGGGIDAMHNFPNLKKGESEYEGYTKYTGKNGQDYYVAKEGREYVAYDADDNEVLRTPNGADMLSKLNFLAGGGGGGVRPTTPKQTPEQRRIERDKGRYLHITPVESDYEGYDKFVGKTGEAYYISKEDGDFVVYDEDNNELGRDRSRTALLKELNRAAFYKWDNAEKQARYDREKAEREADLARRRQAIGNLGPVKGFEGVEIDLGQMEPEDYKVAHEALQEIAKRYPNIKNVVKRIVAKDIGSPNTRADYSPSEGELRINTGAHKRLSPDQSNWSMSATAANSAESLRATIYHELGHGVFERYTSRYEKEEYLRNIFSKYKIGTIVTTYNPYGDEKLEYKMDNAEVDRRLSIYASASPHELMAEVWAKYNLTEDKKSLDPMVKEVGDWLAKNMNTRAADWDYGTFGGLNMLVTSESETRAKNYYRNKERRTYNAYSDRRMFNIVNGGIVAHRLNGTDRRKFYDIINSFENGADVSSIDSQLRSFARSQTVSSEAREKIEDYRRRLLEEYGMKTLERATSIAFKLRYVRTAAGARRYGLPIGSVISDSPGKTPSLPKPTRRVPKLSRSEISVPTQPRRGPRISSEMRSHRDGFRGLARRLSASGHTQLGSHMAMVAEQVASGQIRDENTLFRVLDDMFTPDETALIMSHIKVYRSASIAFKIRRVRTAAGARRFGQPIGTIIEDDGTVRLPGVPRGREHEGTEGDYISGDNTPVRRRGPRTAKPYGGFPGMSPATPERIQELKEKHGYAVPPAWTDVHIADDLETAKLMVRGKDTKGRVQSVYSAAHTQAQAEKKFQRVKEFSKHLDKLDTALERDAMGDDSAAALLLIRRLGMRPGSDRDTGAEKAAHGATNLKADHVEVTGDVVKLDFTGKKGVHIQLEMHDPYVAQVISKRLETREGQERLFDTDEQKTRDYMRTRGGVPPEFLLKDLRTVRANVVALQEVQSKGGEVPKNKTEFRRWRKQVAEKVSAQLGNTPTLALASYINPAVFTPWVEDEGWV